MLNVSVDGRFKKRLRSNEFEDPRTLVSLRGCLVKSCLLECI